MGGLGVQGPGEHMMAGLRSNTLQTSTMCSCKATVACKHIAKALMHCVYNPDSMSVKEDVVPEAVHQKAVTMVAQGLLHATSPEARARNHMASAVSCPPEIAELVRWGYISPNYNWAPLGLVWKRTGKNWKLGRREGE